MAGFQLPEWEGFAGNKLSTDDVLAAIEAALAGDDEAQQRIVVAGLAVTALLLQKNRAYGNSALQPLSVFSKLPADERMKVRMDDKLSRLARGCDDADQEDPQVDLTGYLHLLLGLRLTLDPA